jgi:hypothetical protein
MYKALFAHSPLLVLPLLALGIFATVFMSILIATFLKKSVAFEPVSALPLAEDDQPLALSGAGGLQGSEARHG